MKKNCITSYLILFTLAAFSLSISGCAHKDKETVLATNVKVEAKQEKNQVEKYIELGNKLLDKNDYDGAKSAYDKAIKLDKMNRETYLKIEDKYFQKDRIEDAANIIQEAINNNVDTENMKKLLSQINAKIEAAKAINRFNENERNKKQNKNKSTNTNTNDDPSQPQVVQNKRIIGFVQNIYEKNGKRYLTIKEVEFYRGDKAVQEAKRDGYKDDLELMNDYYIRYKDKSSNEYEISNSCGFSTEKWQLNEKGKNAAENEAISYDKIKSLVSYNNNISIEYADKGYADKGYNPANLYWLTINNNVVVQMDAQYTP